MMGKNTVEMVKMLDNNVEFRVDRMYVPEEGSRRVFRYSFRSEDFENFEKAYGKNKRIEAVALPDTMWREIRRVREEIRQINNGRRTLEKACHATRFILMMEDTMARKLNVSREVINEGWTLKLSEYQIYEFLYHTMLVYVYDGEEAAPEVHLYGYAQECPFCWLQEPGAGYYVSRHETGRQYLPKVMAAFHPEKLSYAVNPELGFWKAFLSERMEMSVRPAC